MSELMRVRKITSRSAEEDIKPYIAMHHSWDIGDVLICKESCRFYDSGNAVDIEKGELVKIADYTTLSLLDFIHVHNYFYKPKRVSQDNAWLN